MYRHLFFDVAPLLFEGVVGHKAHHACLQRSPHKRRGMWHERCTAAAACDESIMAQAGCVPLAASQPHPPALSPHTSLTAQSPASQMCAHADDVHLQLLQPLGVVPLLGEGLRRGAEAGVGLRASASGATGVGGEGGAVRQLQPAAGSQAHLHT